MQSRRELFQSLAGNRRSFLKAAAATSAALSLPSTSQAQSRPPNVILVCCDDLGYGDLSCYGGRTATPNLDKLAAGGVRFTQHTSAACVCSPARAAVMTGRYPNRYGIPRVIDPDDTFGLPATETTIAAMLKPAGYSTTSVGKWHLGSAPGFLPTDKGFDEFYGIPYSPDMYPLPLMHNAAIVEEPTDASLLAQKFTAWAVNYIDKAGNKPFFMYYAPASPHLPLMPSTPFQNSSGQGLYGDVLTELDAGIGSIMQALAAGGLDSNTLVLFTSDHGPWYQGSAGGLRKRKGEIFEGGVRVPFIARFPGAIPPNQVCNTLTSGMDFLPTIAAFTGASLPPLPADGIDISPLLRNAQATVARDALLYFNDVELQAARIGDWKLHVARFNTWMYSPEPPPPGRLNLPLPQVELYNVGEDKDESYDRSLRNPATVAAIQARMSALIQTFPADIANTFSYTLGLKVQNTAVGALPVALPQSS